MDENGIFVTMAHGVPTLTVPPALGSLMVNLVRDRADHGMRRTPVEDMQGDALDRVELEMANDAVHVDAVNLLNQGQTHALALLSRGETVPLTRGEDVQALMMFFNEMFSRVMQVGAYPVGEAQGDAVDTSPFTEGNDVELIVKNSLAWLLSELALCWRENF